MKRLLLTAAVLLSTAACETPEPAAPVVEAPTAPRFTAGHTHVYRFAWTSAGSSRGPAIMPEDLPVSGGLDLAGTVEVRVAGEVEGGTLLAVSFAELHKASVFAFGRDVLEEPGMLMGQEAFMLVPNDSRARDVYFEPSATPLFRQMMTGLLAQTELSPATDAERQEIRTAHGIAHANYERDGSTIRRALTDYLRVDAAWTGEPSASPRVDGSSTVRLGPDGVTASVDSDEILTVAVVDAEPLLKTTTHFELEREQTREETPRPLPDLELLEHSDLMAPPDYTEADRELARRFGEGITSFDVSIGIRSAGLGLKPQRGFVVRAVGLLKGWPERATDMVGMFDAFDSTLSRGLTMDILASAGTPEAQAVMRELLSRDATRRSVDYSGLLQRFAFVERPDSSTAAFLLEAQASATGKARAGVLYPMGAVAQSVAYDDPIAATALLTVLRNELQNSDDNVEVRAGALGGLGNAGHREDRDRIIEQADQADIGVRGAAATALSRMVDGTATETLIDLVSDSDRFVAHQALVALAQHLEAGRKPGRLAAIAIGGLHHEDIAGGLALAVAEFEDDAVREQALTTLMLRTTDPRQLRTLQGLIADVG